MEGHFYSFPQLPAELRLQIWRECLPHRPPCKMNWKTSRNNKAPPLIVRVCHESRAVAFETGRPQLLPDPYGVIGRDRFSNYMIASPWLDTARDSVHLNWTPFVDIEWQSYDWGDPVRCLMYLAAQTRSRQASIMLDSLVLFQHRSDPDELHWHYRWTRTALAELMRSRQSWTVVILPPVIIHANVETTAGLFGLLADVRVQLVGADEESRINEFLALGEASTVSIGSRFKPEEVASTKEELQDAVRAVFGSENSAPAMRPAVMFRLCTGGVV
ncbi:hypothetical protein BDV11DRAFT_211602 [Aspergillus similis]